MEGQFLAFWFKDKPGTDRYSLQPKTSVVYDGSNIDEYLENARKNMDQIHAHWLYNGVDQGKYPCVVLAIHGKFFCCTYSMY